MLIAPRQYNPGTILQTDVCIIGGGAAAISIALSLMKENLNIIMLAGGSWYETSRHRKLNKGHIDPTHSHEPLEENRRRVFGGATSVWGGRCVPFDPIDLEKRSWIPHSGWPIDFDELVKYYSEATKICEAGKALFDARKVFPEEKLQIIDGLDNEDLVSYKMEKWSPPTRFAFRYKKILEDDSRVAVYLDAHVLSLNTEEKSEQVSSVSVSIQSSIVKIQAKKYVLATGGIENPRLLLASASAFHPSGIGNDRDNVGRYYMSHLMGTFGAINPQDRKKIILNFEQDPEGILCRRRWWFTDKIQREKKIGNAIMFLSRSTNLEEQADPVHSAKFVSRSIAGFFKKNYHRSKNAKYKDPNKNLGNHLKIVAQNSHNILSHFIKTRMRRFQNRHLPYLLPSIKAKWLSVYFQTEHIPNPESRIVLSDEKDEFGIPLPHVKIAFSEMDQHTITAVYKIFFDRILSTGNAAVNVDMDGLADFIRKKMQFFNSGAHHMGTTRMSEDPADGVVDRNCKVHGMENLFIAGSSVFPTGGHANPTLTLIALAIRLAEHLRG